MKERAIEGLGANTRKQADVISVDEETSLYDKGILGVDNPQQLLDTLLYLCGLHFALRGGTEHRRLRLNSNPQITGPFQDKYAKLRYLLYKEDVSKANAGTVKRLCTSIGLTGNRTNHSLRASAATRLYNAGIEEQRVAETTGHRSNAVRVYKRTSADQQIEASNILYGLRPSDGSKKAKLSAAAGAPVGSASVEFSTDETITEEFNNKLRERTGSLKDEIDALDLDNNNLKEKLRTKNRQIEEFQEKMPDCNIRSIDASKSANYNGQYSKQHDIRMVYFAERKNENL
ncbi:unnamed protein product [Mytilus coruscus]|uniref:ZMYM2-like/QRICH1 C-terminal domain-containing protein n=1 Tax=Mytilus coruscus TaxID=42192 RepID=A0A6J8DJ76_MYTCO|nr:unnamed protein product [Mytilus coruscus]